MAIRVVGLTPVVRGVTYGIQTFTRPKAWHLAAPDFPR
jgi:hypothetical protein